ncbi:MAG: hypothetical protein SPJ31_06650 [Oscillospiraceae bacterium]|nr:hypothetical protein [Clostridiaceae bacterium]MDY5890337.1 hypothetical protein [Oscillospiraceae bacterium]MDY5934965.1 hypothetical protein [Oscillospiraceae bacterium]
MDKAKCAKMFMKMARYDCMLLSALKAAKCVLTAAVVINAVLSGAYIVSSLKK